tara:strand:+ start:330 stop:437 length:108 start_codon:yes stop_codon:yes gene_type:complete
MEIFGAAIRRLERRDKKIPTGYLNLRVYLLKSQPI